MKKLLLFSLGLFCFTACQTEDSILVNQMQDPPTSIQFQEVFKYEYANHPETAGTYVINDQESWNTFAAGLDSPFTYDPETGITTNQLLAVEVDFSSYTVIAVVDEQHNHGGFDITISSVEQNDDTINVDVEADFPGDGAVTAVLTQPYHIIKIPKTTLPVVFQ